MKIALVVILAIACAPARAAPLAAYPTLEAAATAALADAEALTADYEAGGSLYQCGASFAYIAPVTSHSRIGVSIPMYTLESCELAGTYHTHPRGDTRYSPDDIRATCEFKTQAFMKPRNGAIRVFDCRGVNYAALLRVGNPVYGRVIG